MLDQFGNQIPDTPDTINGGGGLTGRAWGGWFDTNDPARTTAAPAVNGNPIFNPSTNITPGQDIPLGGSGSTTIPYYGGPVTPTDPSLKTGATGSASDAAVQDFIKQWQQSHPASEGIGPLAAAIAAKFPGVSRFMYGSTPSNNELVLPSGQKFKVISGEDNPATAGWYTPGTNDSGGSLGSLGQGFGGLTAPFTGQFGPPTNLENQPGYQFARDQGLQAIDRSAASKGTLLTGGNLKDLAGFAGGVASQNYNSMFNQGLQTFQTNRDSFYHNQDSPFNKLYSVSALGRPTTP